MTQKDPTKIFEKHYNEWKSNPDRFKSGYNYEKSYTEMMQTVEKEIFQISLGEAPNNKNRKKTPNPLRKNNSLKRTCHCTKCFFLQHKQLCDANDVFCRPVSCV